MVTTAVSGNGHQHRLKDMKISSLLIYTQGTVPISSMASISSWYVEPHITAFKLSETGWQIANPV